MNHIDINSLTVRELGNIAADRGVSAASLLRDERRGIVWPATY